jgi:hypothetical protein
MHSTLINLLVATFRGQVLHNSESITFSINFDFKRKELHDSYLLHDLKHNPVHVFMVASTEYRVQSNDD